MSIPQLAKRIVTNPLAPIIILIPFLLWIGFQYYLRVGGFSFGDEWTNFVAGFFMQKERVLYSEIFYNHQMLVAYISLILQNLFHPESLYHLVLLHRGSVIAFSIMFDFLLVYRFRWTGVGFAAFYELGKYFLFGHLFLSESFIVQPLVYLFCTGWYAIGKKKITSADLYLSGIFAWFITFMRETFAPLSLLLFLVILIFTKRTPAKKIAVGLFFFLCFLTLLITLSALKDYLFQVGIFNVTIMVPYEVSANGGSGIFKGFFYPIVIFVEGRWNYLRVLLIGLSSLFFFLMILFIKKRHKYIPVIFIIVSLGLAGIRYVPPGTLFFESFHMLPWYGMFVTTVCLFLSDLSETKKSVMQRLLFICFACLFLYAVFSEQAFFRQKSNRAEEFNLHYVHYFTIAEAVNTISDNNDQLFADQWDYLIHIPTNLDSSYRYGIYSFATNGHPIFTSAREQMFEQNPPEFYYTYCPKGVNDSSLLSKSVLKQYSQLYKGKAPSCIYVHQDKLNEVTTEQWEKLEAKGFVLKRS